jgi:RimJ/RimL family protein N-acetyltransferase
VAERAAVRALLCCAPAGPGFTGFRACISPDNTASLHLIGKLGFTLAGRRQHERRGEELLFHRGP